jgi:RHS repeat-associated protein
MHAAAKNTCQQLASATQFLGYLWVNGGEVMRFKFGFRLVIACVFLFLITTVTSAISQISAGSQITGGCIQFDPNGQYDCSPTPNNIQPWQWLIVGINSGSSGASFSDAKGAFISNALANSPNCSLSMSGPSMAVFTKSEFEFKNLVIQLRGQATASGCCTDGNGVSTCSETKVDVIQQREVSCVAPYDFYNTAIELVDVNGGREFITRACIKPAVQADRRPAEPEVCRNTSAGGTSGIRTPFPIVPSNGEKQLIEVDFNDGSPFPLSWQRTYRSLQTATNQGTTTFALMGGQWFVAGALGGLNFRPATAMPPRNNDNVPSGVFGTATHYINEVELRDAQGVKHIFRDQLTTPLVWTAQGSIQQLETLMTNGSITGFRHTDENKIVSEYNALGRLLKQNQRNGQTRSYFYNVAGQLISIANQFGRQLSFTYSSNGLLASVITPDMRSISYQYDSANRLTMVTYPDSTSKKYHYENISYPHLLTGFTDENNVRVATYSYDSNGLAIESVHAGGVNRYAISYPTSTSQPTVVTDPLGTARSYTYTTWNGVSLLASASAPGELKGFDAATFGYGYGLLWNETDFLGNTFKRTTWDSAQRLPTQIIDNTRKDIIWDTNLRLPTLVTEQGRTTAYTYDAQGSKLTETITDTSVSPNVARTTAWTYNIQGLVLTETAPNGGVTTYTYSSAGLPITVRNALGHTTTLAYAGADGAAGRVTSMTAPNGAVTAYTYDARGRMLSSTQSAGTSTLATVYTYTPSGQLASAALPSGHTINYTYDAAQRLVAWQDNRGARGNYTLDAMGNRTLEQIKNTAGQVVWQLARSINTLNRVASETVGAAAGTTNNNTQSTYGYDANGSMVSETNGLNQSTVYALDALRRVNTITNANNSRATVFYNELDQVNMAQDFKGVTTLTARDALGNALTTSSPDAGSQSAQYDALGLPKKITDALGQATTITRDALGRPTLITQADGRSTQLRYDLTGTTYNAAGFANASKGYLSEIQDTTDKTSYLRDGFGRVIKKTQQLAPFTSGTAKSVSYSYVGSATNSGAGKGQLASITYPNNTVVSYVYSAAGQITQLNWGANPLITNIQYTPLGQPSSWNWEFADTSATTVLPATRAYDSAGRVIATELGTYTYDAAGRIASVTQQLFKPANTLATSTAVVSATAVYNIYYDNLGRITSFRRDNINAPASSAPLPAREATFSYDSNGNRLTSLETLGFGATAANTQRNYSVDPAGNRLVSFNQTLSTGSGAGVTSAVNYQHDANGSMTSDGLRRYEFDAANRLAAMTVGAVDTSPTTRYVHNALGQRLFKTEPQFPPAAGDENDPAFMAGLIAFFSNLWGGNTGAANPSASEKLGFQYFYDEDGSLLYELGSGGANSTGSAHYVYLPTPSGPMPVAFYNGSKHYAVQTDHLNTPRRLTQSDKKVAWQWAFSAFGDEQPTTGKNRYVDPATTPNAGSTTIADVTFNLRYPGQYFDKESGLSYNYFRSYDPRTGRYTQSDPIDLAGGWNKFGYAGGNPLTYIDPLGLWEVADVFPSGAPIVTIGRAFGALAAYGVGVATGNDALAREAMDGLQCTRLENMDAFGIMLSVGRGGSVRPQRGLGGTGWRGDKAWRDAVNGVRSGGDVNLPKVPTKQEGVDLINQAGGRIDRIEGPHLPPNPHNFPHINYTTPAGGKGTIPITGL